MKRYIALSSIFAVFSVFWACSSSTDLAAADDNQDEQSVASSTSTKSSASKNPSSSGDSVIVVDSTKINKVIDSSTVYISSGKTETPYYSSAVAFCWNEGCEANLPSSSSKAKSSSGGGVTIDTPSDEPPTVNGDKLIDNRDQKTYNLKTVGGKLWMAQDLNYAFGQSKCFNNEDSNCDKYGRLYTNSDAQKVCPKGWRLPNRSEAEAVMNDDSYPWSYSGRCKSTNDCGFTGEMGFHWIDAEPQSGDKNYDENQGSKFTVIIVEKEPGYAGENEQKFFQVDDREKHFSVRCVQE
jgi:uncharacterized protein (TIGR02145 family)